MTAGHLNVERGAGGEGGDGEEEEGCVISIYTDKCGNRAFDAREREEEGEREGEKGHF